MVPIALVAFHVRRYAIRMVEWQGRRWFVAIDVARAMGFQNMNATGVPIPLMEQARQAIGLPEGTLEIKLISEQGLRFALARRRNPVADEFRAKLAALSDGADLDG
jgi:prophage antirepressor-like protein